MKYYDKTMGLDDAIEELRKNVDHLSDVKGEIIYDLTKIKNELNSLFDCEDTNDLFEKIDSIITEVDTLIEIIEE